MTIQSLIDRCIKGDRRSQKELFDQYTPYLYVVASRYTIQPLQIDDVLQEAWIKIFANLDNYTEEGKLKYWMARIVINQALKARLGLWSKVHLIDELYLYEEERDLPKVFEDMGFEELVTLVDRLEEGYRLIFKMHVMDGLKHEDIGKILGITASTSRSKLCIARKKLVDMVTSLYNIKCS